MRKTVGIVFSIIIETFTFFVPSSGPQKAPKAYEIQNVIKACKQKLKQAAYNKMINFGKKLDFLTDLGLSGFRVVSSITAASLSN